MKAVNVLEVIRQGQVGGGESHLSDLIAGFDSIISPIVLSFTDGQMIDLLTNRGVKCYVIHTSNPFDISISKEIKKIIRKENIQLIHAHGSRAASNIAFIAKAMCIPMIYTVHGWSFHQDQSFWIKKIRALSEKVLCRLSRKVICVSENNKRTGEETFGLKNAIVIENGINLTKFNPDGLYKNIREEFGFLTTDFIIGFIGRVTIQKSPIDFIKSISIARSKNPRIKALLIGEGDMLQEVKDTIGELNLEDSICISPFRSDIPDILQCMDVFSLPSLWEGLSIALLEAMSMRKAIVATPTDGTREIIIDHINGLIVDYNSPEKLAGAYIAYLNNPALSVSVGINAYNLVEKRFNSQRVSMKVAEEYKQFVLQSG